MELRCLGAGMRSALSEIKKLSEMLYSKMINLNANNV